MPIDYDHALNKHTLEGAWAILSPHFHGGVPGSVLEEGCGCVVWLRRGLDFSGSDVQGIDDVGTHQDKLLISRQDVLLCDHRKSLRLARRFDLFLCLEVPEHLDLRAP